MATRLYAVTQQEIIAFLKRPESHQSHAFSRDAGVRCVETHAALIFLVGDLAYKLKRAVRLPFLDFSTLEKRHAARSEEHTAELQSRRNLVCRLRVEKKK